MAMTGATVVNAGAGWGLSNGPDGAEITVPTFYAHSPSGKRDRVPANAGANYSTDYPLHTGKALRKFVDPLPGVGASANTLADGVTSKYIPAAVPTKWVTPEGVQTNDDYYELAVVQYKEKMHSDLANATTLRGYVQLTKDTSKFALTYPDGSPILIQDTDALGKLKFDANGNKVMVQAYAVDKPHYLGPALIATKGTATRIKFHNLLPVGRYNAKDGRNGDLFIPVDETLPGAGVGPDGVTRYTQNRAELHLHGGDTPWISDGTPHQWIAPAGESAVLAKEMAAAGSPLKPAEFMRGASAANVPDMNDPGEGAVTYYYPNLQSGRLMWYHDHTFGLTRLNAYVGQAAPYVLVDPAQEALLSQIGNFPGADSTLYLVLQDKTFIPDDIKLQDARWNVDINGNTLDGQGANPKPLWGEPGDLWYPHVYEVNQDPNNGIDGTNPVGRWDWGPYFWPVFPSLYNLPTGKVGDVTLTPEAWMDTPVINGVAYPTLSVDPKPYRMRILNGANDRFFNMSMFVADTAVSTIEVTQGGSGYDPATTTVTLVNKPNKGGSGATAEAVVDPVSGAITAIRVTNAGSGYTATPNIFIVDKNGNKTASASATLAVNTEVKMVPAAPATATGMAACQIDANGNDIAPPYAPPCWPSNWPTDGRDGGVPDPATAGPMFYQIGTEGGLLPQVAEIPAAPMQYEYNRRSVTVLNTWSHGLFLGNAERADVVVDFSNFAGQTLIVYNDAPAPVPAFDPRNDHWTGKPDESDVGSVETPRAGYGPNTRTMMQIKVADKPAATPLNVVDLKNKLPEIYGATQERPVVAQSQYSAAFKEQWSDAPQADGTKAFATIFTGSLQEPAFKFTPGVGAGSFNVKVVDGGSGYVTPPAVSIIANPADGVTKNATATASLKIAAVNVVNGGAGYLYEPTVTFNTTSAGTGASARAWLKVNRATGLTGGSGYPANADATNKLVKLFFSAPSDTSATASTAWGYATTNASGAITGFTLVNAGRGYTRAPLLSPVPYDDAGVALPAPTSYPASATVDCSIDYFQMLSNDPNHPELAGGMGYDNLRNVTVNITAPTGPGARAATTTLSGAVADVTLVYAGEGYKTAPTIDFTAPAVGTKASATANIGGASMLVKNKAIQELFDPTYGRMNATLGIEIPFTSALTQTTIPLGYVDPVTEEFNDGETQIWKITHNGVDAHPVHFHLLNVQLINRVGWDGTIKPPKANEFGWKETIRMNPLEDILVAVRAKKPALPGFGVPNSIRRRDPSQPANVPTGFTQIDVKTGLPATVLNVDNENYGWEYVWHCHILGHEENDFMRPVKFNANEAIPVAPTNVTSAADGTTVTLNWTDVSTTEYKYQINRIPVKSNGTQGAPVLVADLLANSTMFSEPQPAVPAGYVSWIYAVSAVGANGVGTTSVPLPIIVEAPTNLVVTSATATRVNLSWTDNATNETSFLVERSTDGGTTWTSVGTAASKANTGATQTVQVSTAQAVGTSYLYRVTAQLVYGGGTVKSQPVVVPLNYVAPAVAPANLAAGAATRVVGTNNDSVTLTWSAPALPAGDAPVATYTIEWSANGFTTVAGSRTGLAASLTTATVNVARGGGALPNPTGYTFRIRGVNSAGQGVNSAPTATVPTL